MISVIIPAHNCASTIEKAIKSVVVQNCDVQIIVVENNSVDGTLERIEKIKSCYDCVELYSTNKHGVSSARNIGLQHVMGEITTFLDADDYFSNDIFNYVIDIMSNGYDIVFTMHNNVYGNIVEYHRREQEKTVELSQAIDEVLCNSAVMGSVCSKFYRTSILQGIKFNESLTHMEDGYYNVEVLCKIRDIKVFKSSVVSYNYVYNPNSATNDRKLLFDANGKLNYNNAVKLMIKSFNLKKKEISSCEDAIFRLALENLHNASNISEYNYMYDDIKKYYFVFLARLFRYDWQRRLKMAILGLILLMMRKRL